MARAATPTGDMLRSSAFQSEINAPWCKDGPLFVGEVFVLDFNLILSQTSFNLSSLVCIFIDWKFAFFQIDPLVIPSNLAKVLSASESGDCNFPSNIIFFHKSSKVDLKLV